MNKLIPLVVTTDDLTDVRAFYSDVLGWEVAIEQDGYLQVRHGSDDADPELAFMHPAGGTPFAPALKSFAGDGIIVSVPVADADTHHAAVAANGARDLSAVTDKPWGWRSYNVADPTGVVLDFFHVVEQAAD